jgi:hypothetical protein
LVTITAVTLTIVFIIGLSISIYLTTINEYIPTSLEGVTATDDAIYVIVTKEKDILLPITSYIKTRESGMTANVYFKVPNLDMSSFRKMVLSENDSSLITVNDIFDTTGKKSAKFDLPLLVRHPLVVANHTERYSLDIFYRLTNETIGDLRQLSIPLEWTVKALDFSPLSYFWIIFSGVLISRVFAFPFSKLGTWQKLDNREYLWVPFSAIITLLIFESFTQQITPTTNILLNFALAFGFGFAFDKAFESWNKAPR